MLPDRRPNILRHRSFVVVAVGKVVGIACLVVVLEVGSSLVGGERRPVEDIQVLPEEGRNPGWEDRRNSLGWTFLAMRCGGKGGLVERLRGLRN